MGNSTTIKVGVVIPNKNDGKFLPVCINSILKQSSLPDEIIYVDDNSSDNSLEIANNLLASFKNKTIISNKKSVGAMAVLNQGIRISSCDYLIFPASNDALADGIIENFRLDIKKLAKQPGIWSGLVDFINEDGKLFRPYYSPLLSFQSTFISPEKCINYSNNIGSWFTGTTAIYHRETLIKVGMFQLKFGGLADLFAAFQLASLKGAIFCPKKYGFQRLHGEGYLFKTLNDLSKIDPIISSIVAHGKKKCPKLFTDAFIKKVISRIRFSSLAQQSSFVLNTIPEGWIISNRVLLSICASILPKKIFKVVLYFFMRPADIFPAIIYRTKCYLYRNLI
jgi:glycosyltransferase involved in cell wall biosynthesis